MVQQIHYRVKLNPGTDHGCLSQLRTMAENQPGFDAKHRSLLFTARRGWADSRS
jgi:hypothetical protein